MKVQYEDGQFPHIGIPVGEPSLSRCTPVSTTPVSILELHYFPTKHYDAELHRLSPDNTLPPRYSPINHPPAPKCR